MATLLATRATHACRYGWPLSRRQDTRARATASAAASSASPVRPSNRRGDAIRRVKQGLKLLLEPLRFHRLFNARVSRFG